MTCSRILNLFVFCVQFALSQFVLTNELYNLTFLLTGVIAFVAVCTNAGMLLFRMQRNLIVYVQSVLLMKCPFMTAHFFLAGEHL